MVSTSVFRCRDTSSKHFQSLLGGAADVGAHTHNSKQQMHTIIIFFLGRCVPSLSLSCTVQSPASIRSQTVLFSQSVTHARTRIPVPVPGIKTSMEAVIQQLFKAIWRRWMTSQAILTKYRTAFLELAFSFSRSACVATGIPLYSASLTHPHIDLPQVPTL